MSDATSDHQGIYREIGRRIREQRNRRSMTQDDLAKAVALTRTSITNIERGRQKMMIHTLIEVARVLGVSHRALLPESGHAQAHPVERLPDDLGEKDRELIRSAIVGRRGDADHGSSLEESTRDGRPRARGAGRHPPPGAGQAPGTGGRG